MKLFEFETDDGVAGSTTVWVNPVHVAAVIGSGEDGDGSVIVFSSGETVKVSDDAETVTDNLTRL